MKCVHRTTRTYPHSNCPFNSLPDSSESEIEKWKRKHEEQRREYDQMREERKIKAAEREAVKAEKQTAQAVPKTVMKENMEVSDVCLQP